MWIRFYYSAIINNNNLNAIIYKPLYLINLKHKEADILYLSSTNICKWFYYNNLNKGCVRNRGTGAERAIPFQEIVFEEFPNLINLILRNLINTGQHYNLLLIILNFCFFRKWKNSILTKVFFLFFFKDFKSKPFEFCNLKIVIYYKPVK